MATRDAQKLEAQRRRRNANRAARRAAAKASANTCTSCALRPRKPGHRWCESCVSRTRSDRAAPAPAPAPAAPTITATPAVAARVQRREKPAIDFGIVTDDDIAELERIFA